VGSAAAVTVNLGTGTASGGDAAGDTYYFINNLLGSSNADVLTGNANVNMLNGGAGNDILSGAGGADTLIGGTGDDTLIGGAGGPLGTGDVLIGGTSTTDNAGGSDWVSYVGTFSVMVNLTDAMAMVVQMLLVRATTQRVIVTITSIT